VSYGVTVPDDRYFRDQIKCQSACPVGTDARGYVRAIADGDYEKAYLIARAPNPLASICGRVCGAPCEAACRRGAIDQPVAIRALKRTATERFGTESGRFGPGEILERVLKLPAAEHANQGEEELRSLRARLGLLHLEGPARERPKRVAIVGSGPAGLACAHDLALLGHRAIVFEMEREPAGMLIYGIPEYRLPRDLIRAEVEVIRALGVEFRCATRIGKDVGFDELIAGNDAVVIAVGAKNSRRLRLPGLDGPGVLGGVEFLREVALGQTPPELGARVVVIGGGNVAYDVARTAVRQVGVDVSRTALRQGARSVTLVSLESLEEMPADDVEILEGDEEGVKRLNSLGPVSIERDGEGRVRGVVFKRCARVFDADGRFAPEFVESDTTIVESDTVVLSIGQTLDVSFVDPARDGVEVDGRGLIPYDPETFATSRPGVFVAGDAAYGPKLLIHAIANGKQIARQIHKRLTGVDATPDAVGLHAVIEAYEREADYEKIPRQRPAGAPPAERVRSQSAQVELAFDDGAARREASRCLDCGVNTVFDGAKCVLCGGCVDVCPESCLKIVSFERLERTPVVKRIYERLFGADPQPVSAILKDDSLCIRCALCAERCPNGAITMERFCFGPSPTAASLQVTS
jgi:NADPH-dependent glutamate synthase beta subunit-like oxidoreductase